MEAFDMSSQQPINARQARLLGELTEYILPDDCASLSVTGLATDSREVVSGDLFFAVNGLTVDGRNFINDAVKRGAIAVFAEADADFAVRMQLSTPIVSIPNLTEKLSGIAGRFYANPTDKLSIVGITGTNGKTSCSHLVASLADGIGQQSGVVGTLGYGVYQADGIALQETGFTTPDAVKLQACMKALYDKGCDVVAAEVSSHALAQYRVDAIHFKVAVLTNLSRDHLDFHQDMASYADAKRRLFTLDAVDAAVINIDDPFGRQLVDEMRERLSIISYSTEGEADVYVRNARYGLNQISADVYTPFGQGVIRIPLIGEFNLSNALAALAAMLATGAEFDRLLAAFESVSAVKGRMEIVRAVQGQMHDKTVVVDYAHTPHALELALKALRPHSERSLWCVFGCGGDRDHGKRAEMGRIAKAHADAVVVTSDNPRNEPAEQIIDDILLGIDDMHNVNVEQDRASAIQFAIAQAGAGDVILVAGKGHEQFQIIGDQRLPFSDVDVVRASLEPGQNQ